MKNSNHIIWRLVENVQSQALSNLPNQNLHPEPPGDPHARYSLFTMMQEIRREKCTRETQYDCQEVLKLMIMNLKWYESGWVCIFSTTFTVVQAPRRQKDGFHQDLVSPTYSSVREKKEN